MRRVGSSSSSSSEVTVTRAIWLDGIGTDTTGTSVATSRSRHPLWGRRGLKRHATLLQQNYSKYQMTTHKRLDPIELLLKASTSVSVHDDSDDDDEDDDSDGPSQPTWRPYEGGCGEEEEPSMHIFSLPPFEDYDKEEPCGGN